MKEALIRDAGVRQVVRGWRALTGGPRVRDEGRRTLIACSGGADSSALVLALASATQNLVVAHVVHDMRPPAEALADRDAARALADCTGIPFVEARVTTKSTRGNTESIARQHRYAELARLAHAHGCIAVATAHHADDQLETVLMRLMRGAGMRGMSGIAQRRTIGENMPLVRPMLGIHRADAIRICTTAGWSWQEDHTNSDVRMLRALIRREVVPILRSRCTSAATKAVELARMAGDAAQLARAHALAALHEAIRTETTLVWDRERLRREPAIVLGELLREVREQRRGQVGRDRARWANIERVHAAISDHRDHRRVMHVAGLNVVVEARTVSVSTHHA